MRRSLCALLVVVCLGGVETAGQAPQQPAARPDLPGTWVLNEDLSEDLPLLPGEAVSQARAAGVLPAARRQRSRTGVDLPRVVKVRTMLRRALEASARLTIAETSGALVLTDRHGRTVCVMPGRPLTIEQDEVKFEIVARWETGALLVERRYDDGTVVSDSYATFTEPRQLVISSTILNARIAEPPVTLQRVYDAVN